MGSPYRLRSCFTVCPPVYVALMLQVGAFEQLVAGGVVVGGLVGGVGGVVGVVGGVVGGVEQEPAESTVSVNVLPADR